MTQAARRHEIARLLQSGPVASQQEIVEALSVHGEGVTQATVSRDLRELGAIKSRQGYLLPGTGNESFEDEEGVARGEVVAALRRHVASVAPACSLVVIKTAPGHASLLGVWLDRHPPDGVVGTIAGDDTIFLATASETVALELSEWIGSVCGLGRVLS